MNRFDPRDEKYMAEAIALARQHLGQTGENPSVGAVIVNSCNGKEQIVGRGITAIGGRPHAEPQAINAAGHLAKSATLYVTLEPCCHWGQTPPCTQAIIKAGITRVVIAVRDADGRVDGGGIIALKNAGIKVDVGCLEYQAAEDLGVFLCNNKLHRPFITAKLAISADGFIGKKNAGQIAITGDRAKLYVHQLRQRNDAIMVGIGTVLADNPKLDCRLLSNVKNLPIRIIMDNKLQLPRNSHLVKTAMQQPVWIITTKQAPTENYIALEKAGCRIFLCSGQNGKIDLQQTLKLLSENGVRSVMLEGGTKLMQSFWDYELIDQLILLQSKIIIGAMGYKQPDFSRKKNYQLMHTEKLGRDIKKTWLQVYGDNSFLPSF